MTTKLTETAESKKKKEEEAKKQGLLDGIDWETYKAQNSERVKLDVDQDLYSVVSDASGIAVEDITIVAYEEPFYVDKEGMKVDYKDIIYIAIAILIVVLFIDSLKRYIKLKKIEEVNV